MTDQCETVPRDAATDIMSGTVRALIVDLDQCLYDRSLGLPNYQRAQCYRFLKEWVGAPADRCAELGALTLDGVRAEYPASTFTDDDFAQLVFQDYPRFFPVEATRLRAMFEAIPLPKVLLSNNIRIHCMRVLQLLGLTECFYEIVSADELHGLEKPHKEAFAKAAKIAGCSLSECCMIDDSLSNLRGAKSAGMLTVWVAGEGKLQSDSPLKQNDGVDFAIELAEELVQAMPFLLDNGHRFHQPAV